MVGADVVGWLGVGWAVADVGAGCVVGGWWAGVGVAGEDVAVSMVVQVSG